ncbi:MAG: amidase domain-containing protein, partial [Anaerolineales bacterium]|nr:amidase domain-containing protein [Anaerolineales bacterium]
MIKSKRIVFVVLSSIAVLFAAGNLVTSVQANNENVITTTPTATLTSFESSTQGDSVPLKQQEELKSVIQTYFEFRYNALSISQPYDLQLNGFGGLVSDGPDAKAFMDAELAKLAIEIRRAELYDLKYADYEYFLDFRDFVMDAITQTAKVSVIEEHNVIYESAAVSKLEREEPIVSHLYNREHTITLRREDEQWKIVSDDYNDYLWRMLRQGGKTKDEMIKIMESSLILDLQIESDKSITSLALSPDASSHDYDRVGAADYAVRHIDNYNADYPTYDGQGGDCTNFISQAIYEDGDASMFIPDPLPPPSNDGQEGWYLLNEKQRGRYWNDVEAFYDFVTQSYLFWDEGPEGSEVATIDELMLGDVIQFEWPASKDDSDDVWDHAVIIVGFDASGTPLVASHSDDVGPEPYTYFAPWQSIRFIHIERIDGYPPVKAEVTQGSDDAGPNLACAFSSTRNEVYFGACSNGNSIDSGFQFRNIQIPQGAQIKYAYVIFTTDGPFTAPLDLKIDAETTGNPVTFTSANPPGSSNRLLTNDPVLWSINDTDPNDGIDTLTWTLGLRRSPPNVASLVETVVNGSWQQGNSLSFIIKNNGSTGMRRVIALERSLWDKKYSPAKLIAAYDFDGTPPPTSTPIIPTSTSVPTTIPTSTPVPPTNTPQPTATLAPCSNPCTLGCILSWFGISSNNDQAAAFRTVSYNIQQTLFDIQLFHRVEDEILSQTPQGQHYIDLYYGHGIEISEILRNDTELRDEAIATLQLWEPNLQALVDGNGNSVTITSEQVQAIQDFLDHLSAQGSLALQQTISSERANAPLEAAIGMKMDQAWIYLNSFPSTPILDNFNRANGAMGHNWSGNKSKYAINTNQLKVISNSSNSDAFWSSQAFGADQEAYFTFSDVSATATEQDLLLKSQSNSTWGHGVLEVWYDALNQRAQVWTYEWHEGWVKYGADIPVTFADGDQFGARSYADGTVEVYKNGTLLATRDITSWLYYDQGGYIGVWFIGAQNAILDDFGGGTISGGMQSMLAEATAERTVTSDQLDVSVNATAQFWQGIAMNANQTASVTFASLQAGVKPQSNGVW